MYRIALTQVSTKVYGPLTVGCGACALQAGIMQRERERRELELKQVHKITSQLISCNKQGVG